MIPRDGFVAGEWASSDELDVDWMGDTEGRWRKYSTEQNTRKQTVLIIPMSGQKLRVNGIISVPIAI